MYTKIDHRGIGALPTAPTTTSCFLSQLEWSCE